MVFNAPITGIENEIEFVKYLNGKRVSEVHPIFQELFQNLFPNISNLDTISAWKNPSPQKTDIYIKIKRNLKRISIKKGIKNSVHVEPISEFIHFLIKNHVNKKVIDAYLKYHYADGTNNGTGKKRLSVAEYKIGHEKEIAMINDTFNKKILLEKITERFVLLGRNDTHMVDAIIYGVVNDFMWITKEEIKSNIERQGNIESSAVHFGPLFVQPLARCLNYNPTYEYGRYCVQLKWYNISDDIIKVMLERNNNLY